jgi:uncharacterized caspase-like protein
LFYYAGHGLQVDGENYLVPVDASITSQADVEIDAVPADLVLKQMAFAGSRVNIVILDSCRNNPLARDFRSVAAAQGFTEIRSKPKGTFISYSTAPGEVAVDGSNGHSPFATALAEVIQLPGLDLPEVFQRVRERVLDATDQKQTPWDSSSLVKSFYFVPPKDAQPAANLVASAETPAAMPATAIVASVGPATSATTAGTAVRTTEAAPVATAAGAYYVLACLGVAYSVFGLYYYLRIANAMFMREAINKERLPISLGMRAALGITALGTVVIGIFPEQFIRAVNWSLRIG